MIDLVEFYSLKEGNWKTFNAKLTILRLSASACYYKDYIYVIGGHNLKHPDKFINTIERCHKSGHQSFFEVMSIHSNTVNLSI